MRVCVAEDNVVNSRLAQRMLSKMGIKPVLVADGIEAVEAAQAQDFDLIFMDVDMPRLSGLGATGRIRASLPEARQPWIVAMTAAAFEEDRQRCADAGMDDFVAKPFTERDLRERLQVYLRRKGRL
jgi:CheY-like chemotaxis protein